MFNRYKNIIIALIIIAIAFVVYTMLFTGGNSQALITETVDPSRNAVEQELIALLLELNSIKLDTSIFVDQDFQSLQDFSQELVSEPVGRTNPFAPL